MRGRAGHVIHEYFAKLGQESSCLEQSFVKVGFTKLAKVLEDGDLCGRLVKLFSEELWHRTERKKWIQGAHHGNSGKRGQSYP